MSPRRAIIGLTSVCLVLSGCETLKEQMTKDGATPGGAPAGASTTQPTRAAGLDPGWELAPSATYTATQSAGEVTIRATGEHPSAGYDTKLVQSMLRIWPPQWMLAVKKPDGAAAAVMTPFDATGSFKAKDPVETVSVRDARGLQKVPVEQAKPATQPATDPSSPKAP
jgi:hypothetical protein